MLCCWDKDIAVRAAGGEVQSILLLCEASASIGPGWGRDGVWSPVLDGVRDGAFAIVPGDGKGVGQYCIDAHLAKSQGGRAACLECLPETIFCLPGSGWIDQPIGAGLHRSTLLSQR